MNTVTIVINLLCILYAEGYDVKYCRKFINAGPIRQTKYLSSTEYACASELTKLNCCVSGENVTIQWWDNSTSTNQWEEIHGGQFFWDYQPDTHRQTLMILRTDGHLHNTTFKCIALNNTGGTFQHIVQLIVQKCSTEKKKPMYLGKNIVNKRLPGEEISFDCSGKYVRVSASTLDDLRCQPDINMLWAYNDNVITGLRMPRLKLKKYHLNVVCSEDGTLLTTTLTIQNITSDDYGTYQCTLINPYGNATANFSLQYGVENPVTVDTIIVWGLTLPELIGSILGLIAFLALLTTISAIIQVNLRIDIYVKVWWKDTFGSREDSDEIEYDISIVYHQDNEEMCKFVHYKLAPELEEKLHYTCLFEARDFLPGTNLAEEYVRLAKESKRVLFVMSPSILEGNSYTTFAFDLAQSYGRKIVFILYEKIPKKQWNKTVSSVGHRNLKQSMKVLPVIEWNEKREKKFFIKLRNQFPAKPESKPIQSSEPGRRRTQSCRRLLSSHNNDSEGHTQTSTSEQQKGNELNPNNDSGELNRPRINIMTTKSVDSGVETSGTMSPDIDFQG